MAHAVPSEAQLRWQDLELGMFVHFGINTFSDLEWSDGTRPASAFHPTQFDAMQWARTAKTAGFRYMVLTAKHHDGFCLWPTRLTEYCVRNSPWKDGQGDVVRELSDACRAYGLGFGVYLSPWDRNSKLYADNEKYDDYYVATLTELLTQYGDMTEVWFDGAGSAGHVYNWARIMEVVDRCQPNAAVFNMGRPTIRWVGNEDGLAPYPCWNVAPSTEDSKPFLLPDTPEWLPAECDVPIRGAHWFWHPNDEVSLRTLPQLQDIYHRSVGHGAALLLNISPDSRGLLPDSDVKRVIELGDWIRDEYGRPAAQAASTCVTLPRAMMVNRAILMEDIALGERVRGYEIVASLDGKQQVVYTGSAIGHKHIARFAPIAADALCVRVLGSDGEPVMRAFQVFSA